jgi:hypothetical protein
MGLRPVRLILLLAASLALNAAFTNCGKPASHSSSTAGDPASADQVIGNTASYTKVVYNAGRDLPSPSLPALGVSVDSGTMQLSSSAACTVETGRLQELRELLATSSICQPAPLPPGSAECMAIGVADVELSDPSSALYLRPVICNAGTYLCAGNDQVLRDLLQDLVVNPPNDCTH